MLVTLFIALHNHVIAVLKLQYTLTNFQSFLLLMFSTMSCVHAFPRTCNVWRMHATCLLPVPRGNYGNKKEGPCSVISVQLYCTGLFIDFLCLPVAFFLPD